MGIVRIVLEMIIVTAAVCVAGLICWNVIGSGKYYRGVAVLGVGFVMECYRILFVWKFIKKYNILIDPYISIHSSYEECIEIYPEHILNIS